jgi:ABC-2 type transport system permease protein
MMLLMVPLLLWFPIINDPNGVLATITSFIPPLIPFVMILRVTSASEPVPFWQIIATLVAGYSWMMVMIWMCAKIFRVGVLMTGKPPTPIELLRWMRYR